MPGAEPIKIHPNFSIYLVPQHDIAKYQAMGYQVVMSKPADISCLLKLSEQELGILTLLMLGKTPSSIAKSLSIESRTVRKILQAIRSKLKCENNIQLAIKVKSEGLDMYLFRNGPI